MIKKTAILPRGEENRTFSEAIMLRKDCLPSQVSEPADLIVTRLKELGVSYTQCDPRVAKLTSAILPDGWTYHMVARDTRDSLIVKDDLGVVWIRITETNKVPVMSVQPQYGWEVSKLDREAGSFDLDIFHPHGTVISSKRTFNPELASCSLQKTMEEIGREVRDLYASKGYPVNWRQLGASTPMPS